MFVDIFIPVLETGASPSARENNRAIESNHSIRYQRGHKGHNSTGTRCSGFLVLESRFRGFLVLETRCRGFLSSEKTPWNHDVVAYLSPFLDVVFFWSCNLDVVAFWSRQMSFINFRI